MLMDDAGLQNHPNITLTTPVSILLQRSEEKGDVGEVKKQKLFGGNFLTKTLQTGSMHAHFLFANIFFTSKSCVENIRP
jgi:hypothetical protein